MSFTEDELQAFNSILEKRFTTHRQEMEQALDQRLSEFRHEVGQQLTSLRQEVVDGLAIDVQTELPWEALAEAVGKALDERLTSLTNSLQHSVANLEQYLTLYLQGLREELAHSQANRQVHNGSLNGASSLPEILEGIAHMERIVESMQVAMTANHALLSNRLYHHQQLPLERAHSTSLSQVAQTNESGSLLSQAKERLADDQEPVLPSQPNKILESEGQ